jgi:putative endonuclease
LTIQQFNGFNNQSTNETSIPSAISFGKMDNTTSAFCSMTGTNRYTGAPAASRQRIAMHDEQPIASQAPASTWYVYILRCSDASYYTGITTDLPRRLDEHNSSNKGARYTRPRRPVELVYSETAASRPTAARREYQIKKLTPAGKKRLINSFRPAASGASHRPA